MFKQNKKDYLAPVVAEQVFQNYRIIATSGVETSTPDSWTTGNEDWWNN